MSSIGKLISGFHLNYMVNDNLRTIHLTEVSAFNLPTSANYKYKCRVQVISNEEQPLLQKDLLTRNQPNWLLDVKNKGDCTIAITLCYREGDISHPWQDAAMVKLATQDCLNGQRSSEQEWTISTWLEAPLLKIKTRLTQSNSEETGSAVTLLGNNKQNFNIHSRENQVKDELNFQKLYL